VKDPGERALAREEIPIGAVLRICRHSLARGGDLP
jgi:hypothetical protein